jgi:hypothetical protein
MPTLERCLFVAVVAGCSATGPTTPKPTPASLARSPQDRAVEALAPAVVAIDASPPLDRALQSALDQAPTRRAYIMTDKPLYQPGETIWFRADLRATRTLLGGRPTGVTVTLTSPRGAVVVQKRVLAQAGVARNDLALADELDGGEYTLAIAADDGTTDQKKIIINTYEAPRLTKSIELLRQAYGAGDEVAAAIEIKRATGEPFAERPLTAIVTVDDAETARLTITTDRAGKATVRFRLPTQLTRGDGLITVMADDGGVIESTQQRIPIVMKTLQLGLFPEGGDLITGVAGRVYFMARTTLGKPADIAGVVIDDRGQTVATLASIHDGLGRFDLTPGVDRSYTIRLDKPAGITATFTVPAARPDGCVLRSVDQRRADTLRIAATCATSRRLAIEAVVRERRLAGGTFTVAAGQPALIELPVDARAQGAVRVTLFGAADDQALAPLAERLVYHGQDAGLQVSVTADRTTYGPRDPVTLKVHAADAAGNPVRASLGLAVVDEAVLAYADDKSGRLMAHLFLEPELGATAADPIEDPNFYFGTSAEAVAGMDALLATRGYRRFEWQPVLDTVHADAVQAEATLTHVFGGQP